MPRGIKQVDGPCAFGPCPKKLTVLKWCHTHYLQQYHGREMRMTKRPVPVMSRDEQGRKWCSSCETRLPESAFASSNGKPDGLQSRCRGCNAIIYRARADYIRDKMREQRFNLTREEFDAMFAAQGERCAICGGTEPGSTYWNVDHDHTCCPQAGISCGKCIRGILCSRCNHGIGHMSDDPDRLRAAANYLEQTAARAAATRGA